MQVSVANGSEHFHTSIDFTFLQAQDLDNEKAAQKEDTI